MARRNTRELILETSLGLFNEFGEPNVTTNHIADEADISPGNLYYHFRSKNDIVLELFKRFLVRFQPLIDIPEDVLLQPEDLWIQLHLSFELKSEYRFIYRNMADLTARVPDLERALRGLLQRERKAAWNSLTGLEQAGALQIEKHEKQLLADSILLNLTYWIPFAELTEPGRLDDSQAQVVAIARVLQLVTPWLRQPQQDQFRTLALAYLSHSS
ncbi:MAG: TetR/AcrR family transcriptional regulator [Xanthomonadales bacterium]|nr:TetR/AcrR family transcriptional regulator [Xanthomonadales bacterium]